VLEYERGCSLRTWWATHSHLRERDLVVLLQPLLDGISLMHGAGFLHLDIKPDNIHVREDDGGLVLLDFGSARRSAVEEWQAEIALTPGFAPIEQYHGHDQGPPTDIYAFGATLYWMVTGLEPPAADARMADPGSCVAAAKLCAGRFSPEFLEAIDWAMHPDAEQRPRTVDDWCDRLFAAQASRLGLQQALRLTEASRARPASWPLAVKMTLSMIVAALLPMAIVGQQSISRSVQALSSSELDNLEALAKSTAGRVSQLLADNQNLARMVSTDDDFEAMLHHPTQDARARMKAKLDELVDANPDLHLVMLMDMSGTVLASNDRAVTGRNFAFRDYFQAASTGREYTTGIVVGAVAGAAGVFYARPVFDSSHRVSGVVVVRIKASSVDSVIAQATSGSARTPFLIDGDGVVVSHPDSKLLYSALRALPPASLNAIQRDQRFRRDHIEDLGLHDLARAMTGAAASGHVTYHSRLSDEDEIAGFAPVAGYPWVVGVSEPRRHFEQPLHDLVTRLAIITLLVGSLFVGLALLFARGIVRPIQALTRAAEALKAGNFAQACVPVKAHDEIGQLSRTFNVMVDVLRDRELARERGHVTQGRPEP
jgi:HAMP domain-containing protein